MSLSNIQRSLHSSRKFLWNLKERMSSGKRSRAYSKVPKNFTFNHGEFESSKNASSKSLKWLFIIPVSLVLGVGGLIFIIIYNDGDVFYAWS